MSRSTGLLGRMTWMELKLLLREPLTMIFIFGFPLLVPVVLGEVFGNMPDHPNDPAFRGVGPMDYYVPAYIGLAVSAAIVGAVVIAAAGSLMYQVHGPEDLAAVLAGFVLSVACFASVGVLLGAVLPSARSAQGIGLMLFFVMMMLSGTDGPREVMGEVLRRVGDFFPLTHVVVVMQDPWIGRGMNGIRMVLVLAITLVAAIRAFRLERRARVPWVEGRPALCKRVPRRQDAAVRTVPTGAGGEEGAGRSRAETVRGTHGDRSADPLRQDRPRP